MFRDISLDLDSFQTAFGVGLSWKWSLTFTWALSAFILVLSLGFTTFRFLRLNLCLLPTCRSKAHEEILLPTGR